MAESYRGLTIRIGADTSKLSSALREANGAITAASNQARRLKQALAFDPENAGAMAKQFSVVGEQASSVTSKLAGLRQAYADVTSQVSKSAENGGKTFGQLAQETDNAALAAENLKTRYGILEGDLSNIYTRLSAISHNLGTAKKFKVTDGDSTDLKRIAAEYDVLIKKRTELQSIKGRTDEQDKELAKLNKQIPIYEQLMAKAKELKVTFNEVSVAYDDARTVAKLKDLETELAKSDAQAMQLYSTLSTPSKAGMFASLDDMNEKLKVLSTVADDAGQRAELLGRQVNITPTGILAAAGQMRELHTQSSATRQQISILKDEISKYKAAGIDRVAKQTKDAAKAADEAKRAYDESAKEVGVLEEKIRSAQEQQKRLADQGKKGSDEYRQLAQQVDKFEDELREAKAVSVGLKDAMDTSQAVVEYKNLNQQLDQTRAKLSEIRGNGSLGDVTSSMMLLAEQVGQYATQGMTAVIDSTMTLDDAFANMRKTVSGTDDEFQDLYDSAVRMSQVQPITADTILNIEALGGQLGFANEGLGRLEEFAKVVSGLDVATNMDWETAGTNMAQFFNVFDTNKDLVSNYGSALVDLGNHFATTESDISLMASRIASAGTSIGMSEADVLGLSAALSSMGVRAEAGGSSISTIMTNIDKSVALGTDGLKKYASDFGMTVNEFIDMMHSLDDDAIGELAANYNMNAKGFKEATIEAADGLEEWAKVAGYKTAEDFAAAWSSDPIDALQKIFLGLDDAVDHSENLALMLDDLGVKSIRQLDVSRRLASNPQLLVDAINMANTAWEENTALTTEVEKRNESLSARYETLKNIITSIKTELGEGLSPIVDFAIEKMQGLADIMENTSDGAKTSVLAVSGIVAGMVVAIPIIKGVGAALIGVLTSVASFAATASLPGMAAAAGVVALYEAYKHFVEPASKASKQQADFNSALLDTVSTARTFGGSMKAVKHSVGDVGDQFSGEAKSIAELTEQMEGFNKSIKDIQDPVDESNHLLGEYRAVIDEFAGKGSDYEGNMAKLEWAVRGINEALGTNYTAQDILTNKYKDEENEINNLCDYIDRLIEKRQLQARADAAQDAYTKAIEQQYQAEQDRNVADSDLQAYRQLVAEKAAYYERSDKLAYDHATAMKEATRIVNEQLGTSEEELEANLAAAEAAYAATKDSVSYYEELMRTSMEAAIPESDKIRDVVANAFTGWDIEWLGALDEAGISLDEFVQKAEDAGLTVDDFLAIKEDPTLFFKTMVEESEGDIDALIEKIKTANEQKLTVEVDDSQVDEASRKLSSDNLSHANDTVVRRTESVSTEQVTTVTFDSKDATSALAEYIGETEKVPDTVSTTATANTANATRELGYVISLANSVPRTVTIRINGDTTNFDRKYNTSVSKGNAAGGIRYHADGVILNRPTWIGKRDIAGEAGAEAIIPLTNRRYVQPFADTVAQGMLSKLGEMSGTTNYYSINGLTVAPDSALAKAMDSTFDEARRYARMGRR